MIEVKNIYVDQKIASKEQRQWRDVWILESESFKEPITMQIEYSDHDKEWINATKEWIAKQVGEVHTTLQKIDSKEWERKQLISKYKESMKVKDQKIADLENQLIESEKEKIKILKEVESIKKILSEHEQRVVASEKITKSLIRKTSKEPRVFKGQTFVAGNGSSALTSINVPDGNYIVSEVIKIIDKNEYVENEEMEVHAYNLHVSDGTFLPEYELKGTTDLDNPTATIERTFTLLPY